MAATPRSEADEAFLNEVFDLAVRFQATGESFDVEALLVGRPHLRLDVLRTLEVAKQVAVLEAPGGRSTPSPVIPGFTVLEEAGRGGAGIVYRARQEGLGREVALKVLAPSLIVSKRCRERFIVEARALARVKHPNVVTVHAVVADGDVCAYSMEWVDGCSLAKALTDRGPELDIATVARLGAAVARALEAVHGAGLVHRDVKPGNILLRTDGTPLLSDFGLVQDSDQHLHTATGEFVGTAAFAAPEQLRGDREAVGPWTDVYALGVTLYVALAGETPFGSSSTSKMLRRIEDGDARPLRALRPSIPRDLETIVAKAMDSRPEQRYQTAADLADDLDRFLRFEPVPTRPARLASRARLWLDRRSSLVLAAGCALLALALTLMLLDRKPADAAAPAPVSGISSYVELVARAQAAIDSADGVDARYHLDQVPASLRQWEWRHLRAQADSGTVLGRHDGSVHAVAISPDGRRIATASHDETVRIWDARASGEVARLQHGHPVTAVAWSPDGAMIATGGRLLTLWDAKSSARLVQYRIESPVRALQFQFDGKNLAAGDESGRVRLLSVQELEAAGPQAEAHELPAPIWEVAAHGNVVNDLAFGKGWLASCSTDGVAVLDAATGSRKSGVPADGNTRGLAAHPDGMRLAVASNGGLGVWAAATGTKLVAMHGHRGPVASAVWSPDGRRLASGSRDRTVRLWSDDGDLLATQLGYAGDVGRVTFADDGRRVVSAVIRAGPFEVRAWTPADSDLAFCVLRYGVRSAWCVVDPGSKWIAVCCRRPVGYTAGVGSLADRAPSISELLTSENPIPLATSRDGDLLALGGDESVVLFPGGPLAVAASNLGAKPPVAERIALGGARVTSIAFGAGRDLAIGTADGKVTIRAAGGGRPVLEVRIGDGPVSAIGFDPDGVEMAAACSTAAGRYDVATGRKIDGGFASSKDVTALAFSPDGRFLALAHGLDEAVISIWDRKRLVEHVVLRDHHDAVTALAFSPDGARLASGSEDRTIRLWDRATFQNVATLREHQNGVRSLAWTADGTQLLSGGGDGRIAFRRAPAPQSR